MTQGERVKAIRKELNLTLEKFGDRLGVGKTAISKIEKGENKLTALIWNRRNVFYCSKRRHR